MNDRISIIHKQMEQAPNMQDINQMQGAIKELRRLQTLRDEVIAGAKDG
jgi:hypothetical protein